MYKNVLPLTIAGERHPFYLNEIEVRILYCLSQGLILKDIADAENLSEEAIKDHISNLYNKSKLVLHTHAALVGWLADNNFYDAVKKLVSHELHNKIDTIRKKAAY